MSAPPDAAERGRQEAEDEALIAALHPEEQRIARSIRHGGQCGYPDCGGGCFSCRQSNAFRSDLTLAALRALAAAQAAE